MQVNGLECATFDTYHHSTQDPSYTHLDTQVTHTANKTQ
jgi:hypothetical protein